MQLQQTEFRYTVGEKAKRVHLLDGNISKLEFEKWIDVLKAELE